MGEPFHGDEAHHGLPCYRLVEPQCQADRGRPTSSPEVSDDEDETSMETGSDDTAPAPAPHVHANFTMEQAQTQYNTAMTKV